MPLDGFGREIAYLRISLIDHCNLRCVYCMPLRGLSFVPGPELLTAAEIETVARAAVSVGFRKFRLTGGEPTLRPDIVDVGQLERVAAGSTVAAVAIAMSLVAETAAVLAKTGKVPPTFVSPNVHGVPPGHMAGVYQAFTEFYYARPFKARPKTRLKTAAKARG